MTGETIAFSGQRLFELRSVIDFSVVDEDVARIVVAHGLMTEGRKILDCKTTIPEAEHPLTGRNDN
jgi:hypothetical protein